MSNEERLARLTELARRVEGWQSATVEYGRNVISVWGESSERDEEILLLAIRHRPHVEEAVEAALLVLDGWTPGKWAKRHRIEGGTAVIEVTDAETTEADLDLIERSSLGAGLRAMREEPEAHLAELEDELTPEVMDQIRRADGEPPAATSMLLSLQSWWERHALALRMTSRSVHHALGVAISALEQGKSFPTMQVLTGADAAEPPAWVEDLATEWEQAAKTPHCDDAGDALRACAAELRARAKGNRERGR